MSRGPGRVMRALEARLTPERQPVDALAAAIFDTGTPTRAQVESVRRAARLLREQGRAHHGRAGVRTPISEAEHAAIMERRRVHHAQWRGGSR